MHGFGREGWNSNVPLDPIKPAFRVGKPMVNLGFIYLSGFSHSKNLESVLEITPCSERYFDALMTFGDAKRLLADIPPTKVRYFAAQARAIDTSEFQDLKEPKRRTLLL